jgi:hypothetical protein
LRLVLAMLLACFLAPVFAQDAPDPEQAGDTQEQEAPAEPDPEDENGEDSVPEGVEEDEMISVSAEEEFEPGEEISEDYPVPLPSDI